MSRRPNVTLRDGTGGSGKSYLVTYFIVETFLPFEDGKLITNLPLNIPVICERVAARHGKDAQELASRIELIDPADNARLKTDVMDGGLTPYQIFEGRNLAECHVIVDECHWFCGPDKSEPHRAFWKKWIGELRHQGATLELMTQTIQGVAPEIVMQAAARYTSVSSEFKRDAWLNISFGDWAEFQAKFWTGVYTPRFYLQEWRKLSPTKWVMQWEDSWVFKSYYGDCYNSYSAAGGGTEAGLAAPPEYYFQRLGTVRFLLWFVGKNIRYAGGRLLLVCSILFVLWYCWLWFNGDLKAKKHKPVPAITGPLTPEQARAAGLPPLPPAIQAQVDAQAAQVRAQPVGSVVFQPHTSRIKVVGLLRNAVILSDGTQISIGESINGHELKSIDLAGHAYESDRVYRLQTGRMETPVREIQQSLRPGSTGPAGIERPPGANQIGGDHGGGNAAPDSGPVAGRSVRVPRRDRQQIQ